MPEEFNPYREWLGIEDGRQPANYYELLGVAFDEDDPSAISHRADALTAKIRKIRPGPHIRQWQQLLSVAAAAKTCLLDPAARAAYDAALRAGTAPSIHGEPHAAPPLPPEVQLVETPRPAPVQAPVPPVPPAPLPVDSQAQQAPSPQVFPQAPQTPQQPVPQQPVPQQPSPQPLFPEYGQTPYGQPPAAPSYGYPPQMPGQPVPGPPAPQGYPGQPYPPQPYPGQPYPGQPYPGQPYPAQPYPGQPYPGQPYPAQPYPGQPYPGQPYPGQPYPGQPYPGQVPGQPGYVPPAGTPPGQPPYWGYPGQPPQAPVGPYGPYGMPQSPPAPYPPGVPGQEPAAQAPEEGPPEWAVDLSPRRLSSAPDWLENPGAAIEPDSQSPDAAGWPAAQPQSETPSAADAWPAGPTPMPPSAVPGAPMASMVQPAEPMAADVQPQGPPDAVDPGFVSVQSERVSPPARSPSSQIVLRGLTILVLGLTVVFVFLIWKNRQQTGHSHAPDDPALSQTGPATAKPGADPQKKADPATPDGAKPSDPAKPEAKTTPAGGQPKPEEKPAAEPKPDEKQEPGKEKPSGNGETKKPDGESKPQPPADPAKQQAMKQALAAVRTAMARRDLPAAERQLKTAQANTQGPADEAEVARTETMLSNLKEFWKGMMQVVGDLKPLQEISLGGTQAIVVTADRGTLTYRSEGRNYTYTLKDMPAPIVVALARSGFAKAPSQKVLLGVFLAADANGDPNLAKKLWEEAAKQGEDVRDLLPEAGKPGGAAAAPPAEKKPAPANPEKLKKARDAMHQRLQAEFDQATTIAGKAALARKLLDAGLAADSDPEARFVMLGEAGKQAIASGKASLVCEAADALGTHFAVDAVAMKIQALDEMAKSARTLAGQKDVADSALKAAGAAVQAKRQEEAGKLAKIALTAARRSKSAAEIRRVQAAVSQLSAAQQGSMEEKEE